MFGKHKGHEVDSLTAGYISIKKRVEEMIDNGTLNMNNTKNRLVEIGHCKMLLIAKKNELISEIEENIDSLILILKKRKNDLKKSLEIDFENFIKDVNAAKEKWDIKNTNIEEIFNCLNEIQSKNKSFEYLFEICSEISQKLNEAETSIKPNHIKYLNSLDFKVNINNKFYDIEDLKNILNSFVNMNDYKVMQYFT